MRCSPTAVARRRGRAELGDADEQGHQGRHGGHGRSDVEGRRADRRRDDRGDRREPEGRRDHRRHRRLRYSRRHRSAHPPRDALHGHDRGGDLRERHLRRRLWWHDHAGRFRSARARRQPRDRDERLGPQVGAADLRRSGLPHGDHRLERADLRRDARGGEARGQHLQALHGLQGRADGRGRRDVRLVPALRGAGRAAAGACRERRHRGGVAEEVHGGGAHRPRGSRLFAAARGRGRGGQPRDHDRRRRRRAALHRACLLRAGARGDPARAPEGDAGLRRAADPASHPRRAASTSTATGTTPPAG